jgi:hypothetical protein
MKKQDDSELNNRQPAVEDLTVNEGRAAEVKGGNIYVKTVRFRAGHPID